MCIYVHMYTFEFNYQFSILKILLLLQELFKHTIARAYNMFTAVFVSLRSIIMAELLGIEKLTSSFGLVTMCQGLSAFIGSPIAGIDIQN